MRSGRADEPHTVALSHRLDIIRQDIRTGSCPRWGSLPELPPAGDAVPPGHAAGAYAGPVVSVAAPEPAHGLIRGIALRHGSTTACATAGARRMRRRRTVSRGGWNGDVHRRTRDVTHEHQAGGGVGVDTLLDGMIRDMSRFVRGIATRSRGKHTRPAFAIYMCHITSVNHA